MRSWWCVDIESLTIPDLAKSKDKMEYDETLEWCRSFGKVNEDYVIVSAVLVFQSTVDGKPHYEDIQKKESLIQTLVNAE